MHITPLLVVSVGSLDIGIKCDLVLLYISIKTTEPATPQSARALVSRGCVWHDVWAGIRHGAPRGAGTD